jgi:hypothetical protein
MLFGQRFCNRGRIILSTKAIGGLRGKLLQSFLCMPTGKCVVQTGKCTRIVQTGMCVVQTSQIIKYYGILLIYCIDINWSFQIRPMIT